MSRSRLVGVASIGLLVVVLAASGCQRVEEPKISSPWPRAEKERTIPEPPQPVRWPYTGKKAPSRAAMTKRPLSIKVENSSAARPQVGLSSADVVYETISEGGITRFNCIFQSSVPKEVGPVRSARLSDLWVVPQYDGLFFFSGASSSVHGRVRAAKLPDLSQDNGVVEPYHRSSSRAAPHNLFLDTDEAYATAKRRGHKITAKLEPLQFEERSSEATQPIAEITIPFSNANTVRWVYEDGAYKRFNNGAAHEDAATGKQITSDNVVILWVEYKAASRDKVGSTTFDINLGGKGRVSIFHDGLRLDGEWSANRTSPPKLRTSDGRPIRLKQGRTWFQVIPLNGTITMK